MSSSYKNSNDAAKAILKEILSGQPPGTQASAQVDSQKPHFHTGQLDGETRLDAYMGTVQSDGSIKIEKMHSDDELVD